MKKILLAVLAVMSSSVFANSGVNNPPVATPQLNQSEVNVQTTSKPNIPVITNKEAVPVIAPEVKKEVEPVESKTFNEIQGYSTQTTEEYIKRRNATFNTGLSDCINKIPRNAHGKRDAEAMLKCANSN